MAVNEWEEIQKRIWNCTLCERHERVSCNTRQHTEQPVREVKVLLVGIAPPFAGRVQEKTAAKSATNDPGDNLRQFVERALGESWEELLGWGLFLVHIVKCAIVPEAGHQNPPDAVVDACAPLHLGQEIRRVRPARVVAFGKAAVRGILNGVPVRKVKGFGVSKGMAVLIEKSKGGLALESDDWSFRLHASPFPLRSAEAERLGGDVLREAAVLSAIF